MAIKIPEGYENVIPYLIIKNACAFIDFTHKVFDAELVMKHIRDENFILHAEIRIGTTIIMFADVTEQYQPQPGGFFIYVEDADATYSLALENGADSVSAPGDQPYGRSGGVKDVFGNTWWITSVK